MPDALRSIAALQAVYFVLTGVWPIVHIRSFMAVTGPKRDLWLVKTVGAVVAAIGVALGVGAWTGSITPPLLVLAVGSSAALAAVDVVYVVKGTVSRIYLLDAAAELLLTAGWLVFWRW